MNKQFGAHAHEALTQIVFRAEARWRIPGEGFNSPADSMHAFHLLMKRGIAARDVLAQLQENVDGVGIYLLFLILQQMVSSQEIIAVQYYFKQCGVGFDAADTVQNAAGPLTIVIERLVQQGDLLGMRHPFQNGGMVLVDIVIDALLGNRAFHHIRPHITRYAVAIDVEQGLMGIEIFYLRSM